MKTRMTYCCLFGMLIGAFIGATVAALYQDTNASLLLGTGIGSAGGLALGALVGLPNPQQWEGIGKVLEVLAIVGELFECCAMVGVFFLGLTASIGAFLVSHHLWLSLLTGPAVGAMLICALAVAGFLRRKSTRAGKTDRTTLSGG